ncbi:hypothetical protein [Paenisporosarcina sp. OV554]|uniref:hypothetical protein n=1 Tax=Paenisporosarcina sp. OV554 TaxID=2135694 RepID=UPI000D3A8E00|nr:hypothetical protein [Paenisporosarcina sp. OV554]PUB18248.1 hypothetical protein C8K15_101453 [Paenisporosarcina sp. OV554]
MNSGISPLIRTYLAKQNMFNVIELFNQGAEKKEIIELFEKNLLYQSPKYQNMLLNPSIRKQLPQEQLNEIVEIYKKEQLYQNSINQQIYNLLQLLDRDFNIDLNLDCGCGDPT